MLVLVAQVIYLRSTALRLLTRLCLLRQRLHSLQRLSERQSLRKNEDTRSDYSTRRNAGIKGRGLETDKPLSGKQQPAALLRIRSLAVR